MLLLQACESGRCEEVESVLGRERTQEDRTALVNTKSRVSASPTAPSHHHIITASYMHVPTHACIYVQYSCTVLPCLVVLWSHWYMYVIAGDRVYSPAQCVSVWPPSMYTTAAQTQGRSQDMGPCVCDVHVHVLQCLKT